MVKVGVIGAGINGITCALRIKEKHPNYEVTVFSDEFSPNTTGDGSGGLWYPYCCGKTPGHLLSKWGGETYKFLHSCWLEGGHNVSLTPVYALRHDYEGMDTPSWAKAVFGYRQLGPRQLQYLSRLYSTDYASGHTFTTFIVHTACMLSYLYSRFIRAGGVIKRAHVKSLRDHTLASFDVVINCCGLGARELVPDTKVYPVRGQVMRVEAPWLNEVILDNSTCHYIIPKIAVLATASGGHKGAGGPNAVSRSLQRLLAGDGTAILGIRRFTTRGAKVVKHWTGLRPGRNEVRLEAEMVDGKLVIHNYGHGGSGVTLFWGCATDVLELLQAKINDTSFKSKL